jgi:hypothetical protein
LRIAKGNGAAVSEVNTRMNSFSQMQQMMKKTGKIRKMMLPPFICIVTIGYEGRSLEAFLNLLLQNSVTLLCDVRRNPLSRKYGFSKSTLSKARSSTTGRRR